MYVSKYRVSQKEGQCNFESSLSIDLFKFKISSGDVMSTKFQTLCSKPRSIQLSSSEDMSDYVIEFKKTSIQFCYEGQATMNNSFVSCTETVFNLLISMSFSFFFKK